jgi:hypothetical protein
MVQSLRHAGYISATDFVDHRVQRRSDDHLGDSVTERSKIRLGCDSWPSGILPILHNRHQISKPETMLNVVFLSLLVLNCTNKPITSKSQNKRAILKNTSS